MTQKFEGAIRRIGGLARLLKDTGKSFSVSIQPTGGYGTDAVEIGEGHLHKYRLYAAYNSVTADIRDGDGIEFRGERYIVSHIETLCLGDKPVFRRGTIILERQE